MIGEIDRLNKVLKEKLQDIDNKNRVIQEKEGKIETMLQEIRRLN